MQDIYNDPYVKDERLLLSMQMVLDDLDEGPFQCEAFHIDDTPFLASLKIFHGSMQLRKDCLYFLLPGRAGTFPTDSYAYAAAEDVPGGAPHICCPESDPTDLFDTLMGIFERYHEFETTLNAMSAKGCDLDELCRLGSGFFHNPMYIHDRYFSVLSHPYWIQGMLQLEYNEQSNTYNIPISLIEDFKFNEQYHETLGQQGAAIWGVDQYPIGMRSLYVNLRDGEEYVGRLLINELNSLFLPGQLKVAEYLAQRIVYTMQRHRQSGGIGYRSHDEVLRSFLQKEATDPADMAVLRTALSWREDDTYLCFCISFQADADPVLTEGVLRSRISSMFRGNINFFRGDMLCFVLDLDLLEETSAQIRHKLAPLIRDSLLYCGFSNPISGFENLPWAYVQACASVEYCKRWKDERWVLPFERCAAAYMKDHMQAQMPNRFLASPGLLELIAHDKKHGTEYYQTFKSYLQNDRSIPRASGALIIHRTTLQYRLEKIAEIANLRAEDPAEKLYLMVSFVLLDEAMERKEL